MRAAERRRRAALRRVLPPTARLLPLLVVLACAPPGAVSVARARVEAGDLASARAALEQERARRPDAVDVRVELGEVYYRIARDALDRTHDESSYLSFLQRSMAEFVAAASLDPRDDRPHFYLAMMDVYRGDLYTALRGFDNARKLQPTGVADTNIGEIYVYLGKLEQAERWTERGRMAGAPVGALMFNDMLIHWRRGDLKGARWYFESLRTHHPDFVRTINVARLPSPPASFEDFAGYCCQSPACGPYLKDACAEIGASVRERELSNEAVLRELRLEIEARRKLRKVYEQHKDLDVRIDAPDEPAK